MAIDLDLWSGAVKMPAGEYLQVLKCDNGNLKVRAIDDRNRFYEITFGSSAVASKTCAPLRVIEEKKDWDNVPSFEMPGFKRRN